MKFAAVLLLCMACCAFGQLPVPPVQRGYTLRGSRASTVTVEVFYDLLCPDSKAQYPVLYKLLRSSAFTDAELGIVVNVFPLPYHHHAAFVATGFRAYMDQTKDSAEKQMACMASVFLQQDEFKTQATEIGETELGLKIGHFFATECGFDVTSAFKNETIHQLYRERVVMDWKYAAARTVSGTPIFTVNGVMDNGVGDFTTEDQWVSYIRQLLAGQPQLANRYQSHGGAGRC